MTHLRDQLGRLLDNEPDAPYDMERIVRSGRRARRRRSVAVAAAGTVGAAGLTAAVAVPFMATGGNESSVSLGVGSSPSPAPTAARGRCYFISTPPTAAQRGVARLVRSGKVGAKPTVTTLNGGKRGRTVMEVCSHATPSADPRQGQRHATQQPAASAYHYTERPGAIAARLGAHLRNRVGGFGLPIVYTRPFSQETSTSSGRPSYFGGNVDVREATGYADIGVEVTHEVTELVPFTGACAAAEHCTQTTLPDGSVVRTGQVAAGRGGAVLTVDVHRPDGVVVHAQESNYAFGPDAGTQPHGVQPLTLDELVTLAEDDAFTF